MLVLTREANQSVVIITPAGEEITVRVVEVDRGRVRLGVSAPPSVIINRKEVHDRKVEEQEGQSPQ